MRFFRHRLAVVSLFVLLVLVASIAIFAEQIAPYGYDELDLLNTSPVRRPTLEG